MARKRTPARKAAPKRRPTKAAPVSDDVSRLQRVEAELRSYIGDQAFALALTDALRPLDDPDEMERVATRMLGEYLDVAQVSFAHMHADYAETRNEYRSADSPSFIGRSPLKLWPSNYQRLREGQVVARNDVEHAELTDDERDRLRTMLGPSSAASVPIIRDGTLVATLSYRHIKPHVWTDRELGFLRLTADRAWNAIERSRMQSALRQNDAMLRVNIGVEKLRRVDVEREVVDRTAERDSLQLRLTRAEEAERRRLSRELHDEIAQHLAAVSLGLEALANVAPEGSEVDLRAEQLRALVAKMAGDLHNVTLRLRPKSLDDFGLHAALTSYVEEWSRRNRVHLDLEVKLPERRLSPDVETAIYRIVQEGLSNVAKHAKAQHISVIVEQRDHHVVAIVEDDGQGFIPGETGRLGLTGMRERAALLGGLVEIESVKGRGTTVYARIPL